MEQDKTIEDIKAEVIEESTGHENNVEKDTTPTEAVTDESNNNNELDAITQLQQLSAAQSQLAQVAAAALTGNNSFPFLTNFESLAAMAAATTASSTPATSPTSSRNKIPYNRPNTRLKPMADLSKLPPDQLRRELMNQKVRADNRERKKRWRQQNEERNKDNDLRCRVNKRAHKLFGKEDSEHKRKWIEEEFVKRQQKRKEKERRKGLVDDTLGASNSNQLDLAQHLNTQNVLSNLSDANYLQLLCNNLGIPAAARSIIGSVAANEPNKDESKEKELEQQQQEQQHQEQHQDQQHEQDQDQQQQQQQQQFPLLEILQQLQQYQGESSNNSNNNDLFGNLNDKPEEKLAALLASTLQAAVAAANNQVNENKENSDENNTTTSTTDQPDQSSQPQQQANGEFPMEAVLTLMQLNAGWRQ